MKNNPATNEARERGHEATPASLRGVYIVAGCVLVMLAVCLLSARLILNAYASKRPMQSMQPLGIIVAPDNQPLARLPAPSLELDDGHADFMALRQRQTEKLNSYGWVDRPQGIARIPIERALDLIAARGLPVMTNNDDMRGSAMLAPSREGTTP